MTIVMVIELPRNERTENWLRLEYETTRDVRSDKLFSSSLGIESGRKIFPIYSGTLYKRTGKKFREFRRT